MKKLNYKGVIFDSFAFADKGDKRVVDESDIESLSEFVGGFGWGYICPKCVKKHRLYSETELTEQEIESEIANKENRYGYDGMICCVDNCNNTDALDITFKIEISEIVA